MTSCLQMCILLFIAVITSGCDNATRVLDCAGGWLVDSQLNCMHIQKGEVTSIRGAVEQTLAHSAVDECIRYVISPNGKHVACVGQANEVSVIDINARKLLQSLTPPEDCVQIGAISWKPDSAGFVCHIRTARWDPDKPGSRGIGRILMASVGDPGYSPLPRAGRVVEYWGAQSLREQAWCSDSEFLFGDGSKIKAYDLARNSVEPVCEGYDPIAMSPNGCLYRSSNEPRTLWRLRQIGDDDAVTLTNHKGMRVLHQPIVSPNGNTFVYLNARLNSTLFGLGIGFDYSLVMYCRGTEAYAELRPVSVNREMSLTYGMVWVQPSDMARWKAILATKGD